MRGKDVGVLSAVQWDRQKPPARSRASAGVFQCLVVSGDLRRREALSFTASDQGWKTVVCADSRNARAAAQRSLFGLALVDLERQNGGTPRGFRELTEQLAEMAGLLIVLCGHEDDPHEEIWARKLGAWLYLPGLGQETEVAAICREALRVSRRLNRVSTKTFPAGQREIQRTTRKQSP